jgi:RHS repeat-associated protein
LNESPPAEPLGAATRYAKITLNPNLETDLRGYYVEMAGSPAGPWKRLTKQPVPWWEIQGGLVTYYVRGLGVERWCSGECSPDVNQNYSGSIQCAHFRVIAVDEEGHESAPTMAQYPTNVPPSYLADTNPECSLATPPAPTPAAPTNVTVTANAPGGNCLNMKVEWDVVPGAQLYHVYRYNFASYGIYFYRTHTVVPTVCNSPAQDPNNLCECTTNRCWYVESGDGKNQTSDSNFNCPYVSGLDGLGDSCNVLLTESFYVTAQGSTGGESPRSAIVFGQCDEDGYQAQLRHAQEEAAVLLADANLARTATASMLLAPPRVALNLGVCEGASVVAPVVAPLLKLGQAYVGPPFKVIDLHVDHLGSTRLTTDGGDGHVLTLHEFLPFGEEILPMADASTKMFTGHERDQETGLDYMMARSYGYSLTRFLSPDPIGGSSLDPQSWNRYVYVRDNPLGLIDPTGLYGIDPDGFIGSQTNPCEGKGPMCRYADKEGRKLKKKVKKDKNRSPSERWVVENADLQPHPIRTIRSSDAAIKISPPGSKPSPHGELAPGELLVTGPISSIAAMGSAKQQQGDTVKTTYGDSDANIDRSSGRIVDATMTIFEGSQQMQPIHAGRAQDAEIEDTFIHESTHVMGPVFLNETGIQIFLSGTYAQ